MLLQPRVLVEQPVVVAVVLAMILVGKTVAGGVPVLLLGYGPRVALVVGVSLAQIGEFSFVLLRQGLAAGLISAAGYQVFLAAAIVTMIATPFLSEASHAFAERAARGRHREAAAAPSASAEDHVVILGFGHMGVTLARVLRRAEVAFRIIDLDPDRVRRGRRRGLPIEYGDATNDRVLRRAGIEKARAVIVLLPDPRTTRQTIRHCRGLAPELVIIARTHYVAEMPALAAAGADEVVAEEYESSLEIARRALGRLGFTVPWVEAETDEIRRARHEGFRRLRRPGSGPD
jgi:CPA2 family monovalent cation:H+ antiporter-2